MSAVQLWWRTLALLAFLAGGFGGLDAEAEPRVSLKIPPFESALFPNFSSVVLPPDGYDTLEVLLEGALGEIQTSSVRVTLNGMPMTPFVSVNPMPAGMRAIVKLKASMSPDYAIKRGGESILAFTAIDMAGTSYRGHFYLSVDPNKAQPEAARTTALRVRESTVVAPPQHRPPTIAIKSEWPARTTEERLSLEAEVVDEEGLRRIVIEVNGRDVEEVVLQNERPVRYQGGRIVRATTPGEVSGNGSGVRLVVPVRLARNRINVVAIRAENVFGITVRVDRTVELLRE